MSKGKQGEGEARYAELTVEIRSRGPSGWDS
jgi:hypothetical protein